VVPSDNDGTRGEGRTIPRNTCPSWTGEWKMVGWKGDLEGNVSDGVVNEIGKSVWNVEKNGVICPLCPLPHRNGGAVEKNGGTCPRQINVGKNDWAGPRRRTENDVSSGRVFFYCFIVPTPLPTTPFSPMVPARSQPREDSPFERLSLSAFTASAPTSPPPLPLFELPGKLVLVLCGSSCCGHPSYE
jgi:hypothetical protein